MSTRFPLFAGILGLLISSELFAAPVKCVPDCSSLPTRNQRVVCQNYIQPAITGVQWISADNPDLGSQLTDSGTLYLLEGRSSEGHPAVYSFAQSTRLPDNIILAGDDSLQPVSIHLNGVEPQALEAGSGKYHFANVKFLPSEYNDQHLTRLFAFKGGSRVIMENVTIHGNNDTNSVQGIIDISCGEGSNHKPFYTFNNSRLEAISPKD